MSDAQTDIKRDATRLERFNLFMEQLIIFLQDLSSQDREKLRELARATDEVPRGYSNGQTNLLAKVTDDNLDKLVAKDPGAWQWIMDLAAYPNCSELVALSPFPQNSAAS